MSLSNGERLGSYVVLGPINSGGMGEVYLGRDTRLDRQVAIKILPEAFVSHPDRLRWFERESKMLASLSHPNILAIFDVGTHGGIPYIVTELLHGQTLRECLRNGAVPRRTVVEYGTQTAKGLAAAHSKNIVHCDLKPENIFITSDNQLKILDFGLARPAQRTPRNEEAVCASVQTETTETLIGTASYMSPERVKMGGVDARSDIFSLGSILYELLFGEVAFRRTSQVETMNAVLNDEPVKLAEQGLLFPPSWNSILRRCLEKNPERRFQSASDLAFVIEKLAEQPITSFARRGIFARGQPVTGVIAMLLLLVAGWWAATRFRKPVDPTFRQLVFGRGYIGSARFTPDGESIVYGAAFGGRPRQMYLTRLDGQSSRHMGLPAADILGVSQHGEMAISLGRHNFYNWMAKGTLAVAPLSGGAPHALLEDVCDGDIAPDGKNLAIVRCGGTMETLEFPIGNVLFRTSGWISIPRISRAGDAIAFLDHPLLGDDRGYVSVVDLTGQAKRLTEEWAGEDGLAWSAANNEIWFTSSSRTEPQILRAVNSSGRQRIILTTVTELSLRDIGKNGPVLLTSMRVSTELAMGQRNEKSIHSLDVADENAGIHGVADNGKTVALVYSGTAGGQDYKTYVARGDKSEPILLGDGDPTGISPDGKWILSLLPSDPSKIILYPTEAGESRRFDISPVRMVTGATSWSRDSNKVVFTGTERGRPPRVFLFDPTSGNTRALTPEETSDPLLTPNGEMVLVKDKSTAFVIFSVKGGEPEPTKGIAPADSPLQWDADNRTIYVWDRTLPAKIYRLDPKTGSRKFWMEITPADPSGLLYGHIYISPDGRYYAYYFRRVLTNLLVAQNLR
jgi:eukaryotic-like serine/threonine-protein kinase